MQLAISVLSLQRGCAARQSTSWRSTDVQNAVMSSRCVLTHSEVNRNLCQTLDIPVCTPTSQTGKLRNCLT